MIQLNRQVPEPWIFITAFCFSLLCDNQRNLRIFISLDPVPAIYGSTSLPFAAYVFAPAMLWMMRPATMNSRPTTDDAMICSPTRT